MMLRGGRVDFVPVIIGEDPGAELNKIRQWQYLVNFISRFT